MAKKKSNQRLNVYLNGLTLGTLEYKKTQNLTFTYHLEWLERLNSFPISRSLTLREDPYEGAPVYAYFDNLLPDTVSVRQRIAARMHAESDQVFDLLAVIGRDCVGALQFLREDEGAPKLEGAKGTIISEDDIANRLRNLRSAPLAASYEDDFRLSIAGAQEKTAFLRLEKKWYLPLGETPTTHIFKPQIGELKPGMSFSDSVENEWLCAEIVRAFGMPVTECEIGQFQDIKVLIVKRFDRVWNMDRLIRIPQEDLCQALSVPSFEKYEVEGGPGIIKIMDLLYESKRVAEDRRIFLKTKFIFHLLAAIDGHAKNFSIQWGPSGFQLAPLYDILSAQPMIDSGKFQNEKVKMAMAVGKSRHYKIKEIYRRHFLQTSKLCRYNAQEMNSIIDETLSEVPKVIDQVSSKLRSDFPNNVAESIFSGMKSRISNFTESKE